MMRSNAPLSPLQTKVDALADRMADLSLLMKRDQSEDEATALGPVHNRIGSYFKCPGHGANCYHDNLHRDTKCPRCGTFRHSEISCWARIGPQRGCSSSYSPKKIQADADVSEKPAGSEGNHVSVLTHDERPADGMLVASFKRNAGGEPVAKTRKDDGGEPIPSLLKLREYWTPNHVRKPPKPGRRARNNRTSKNNDVQEHSEKYDVVTSLANDPSGLTFGQLV